MCLVTNLLLCVPARQAQSDTGLTDDKASDGKRGVRNDKSNIEAGPIYTMIA